MHPIQIHVTFSPALDNILHLNVHRIHFLSEVDSELLPKYASIFGPDQIWRLSERPKNAVSFFLMCFGHLCFFVCSKL